MRNATAAFGIAAMLGLAILVKPPPEIKTVEKQVVVKQPEIVYVDKPRIVEKIVEKPVERIVEKPVIVEKEKIVEKPVEKIIVKPVPVNPPVRKPVEVNIPPVNRPLCIRPAPPRSFGYYGPRVYHVAPGPGTTVTNPGRRMFVISGR